MSPKFHPTHPKIGIQACGIPLPWATLAKANLSQPEPQIFAWVRRSIATLNTSFPMLEFWALYGPGQLSLLLLVDANGLHVLGWAWNFLMSVRPLSTLSTSVHLKACQLPSLLLST